MTDFDKEFQETGEELSSKQRFYFVLAYIPFANLVLFFNELKPKPKDIDKFKYQGLVIIILYIIIDFIISLILPFLSFILSVAYLAFTAFIANKAYNGEYVKIEFLEKIIKNFNK